ncbi:hypothetical protein [Sphingobium sp. DC-2]|nr:hypothetical protein [Sphingobium sp. DC-2]
MTSIKSAIGRSGFTKKLIHANFLLRRTRSIHRQRAATGIISGHNDFGLQ